MAGNLRITGGRLVRQQFSVPREADINLVRPAGDRVREAVFSSLGNKIRNAEILDCFSGSGSYGFESISRGAKLIIFIEKNKKIAITIKLNASKLKVYEQCYFVRNDAILLIENNYISDWPIKEFDLIFIDPPYKLKLSSLFWSKLPLKKEALAIFRCLSKEEFICPVNYEVIREKKYGGTWVAFMRKKEMSSL